MELYNILMQIRDKLPQTETKLVQSMSEDPVQAVLELCAQIGTSTTTLAFDIKQMEVLKRQIQELEAAQAQLKLEKEKLQTQAKTDMQ